MRELLRTRLGREIAAILGLKLVALYALWAAFFSGAPRPDADAVARALVSRPDRRGDGRW